jgi:hypothetical protein
VAYVCGPVKHGFLGFGGGVGLGEVGLGVVELGPNPELGEGGGNTGHEGESDVDLHGE